MYLGINSFQLSGVGFIKPSAYVNCVNSEKVFAIMFSCAFFYFSFFLPSFLPPFFLSFLPSCFLLLLFSHQVMSSSLRLHGLQHARLPCPSLSPGVCSNSCPLSLWCHLTISSSLSSPSPAFNLSHHLSFPMSRLLTPCDRRTGTWAPASVLPVNTQGWPSSGLTSPISPTSKGLPRDPLQHHRSKASILQLLALSVVSSPICMWSLGKK